MTIQVRLVSLTRSADELLLEQALEENMEASIYASLVLEMAIRERHALAQQFAEAIAKVERE
jgi:hypothetical protein